MKGRKSRNNIPKKKTPKTIRCFCEGETEKAYIDRILGNNCSKYDFKTKTINTLKEMKDEYERRPNIWDKTIFIIDYDGKNNNVQLLSEMKRAGVLIYYSNYCFELFLLSHFDDFRANYEDNPNKYYIELEKRLNIEHYKKDKKGTDIINIMNAKGLFENKIEEINKMYPENLNNISDIQNIINVNPYTNVGFIMQDLNSFFNL